MIALGLLALTLLQDGPSTIPPEVRTALRRMPAPMSSAPTIAARFVRDTVVVGEKAEFVTVYYVPTKLVDTLRHPPLVKQSLLAGPVGDREMYGPVRLPDRSIGSTLFAVYVSWQTLQPSSSGRIEASPATLTYLTRPTATLKLGEDTVSIRSLGASLVVRQTRDMRRQQK